MITSLFSYHNDMIVYVPSTILLVLIKNVKHCKQKALFWTKVVKE